jgi:hypothetical protein
LTSKGILAKKMFVESICDSDKLLEENIRKVKLSTPDYRDVNEEEAVKDFKLRRENYAKVYEPVDNRDGAYIKIINSQQYIVNNIRGYLPLKVRDFKTLGILEKKPLTDCLSFSIDCSLCHELAHLITYILSNQAWAVRI